MIALLLAACCSLDDKPFTYVFKEGDAERYVSTNTRAVVYKKGRGKAEVSVEQKSANSWKVHRVSADGVAEIGQTISRLRITQTTSQPGKEPATQVVDSGSEETTGPIKALLDDLTASEIRFKMKPNGEVTDVTLPAKLKERLQSKEAAKTPILTEEGLVRTVRNSTFILPKKALKPDDGWDLEPFTYQEGGHWITVKSRITFEGVVEQDGRKLLKFVRNPEYTLKKSDEPNEFAETAIKKQHGEAVTLLDAETRRLVEGTSTESIVTVAGTGENKTEIETTIKTVNRRSTKGPGPGQKGSDAPPP